MSRSVLIASLATALFCSSASAAVLVGWNFDANAANTSPELATTVDTTLVTAGSNTATLGAGLAAPGDTAGSTAWGIRAFPRVAAAPSSIAASGTDYVEFKITPAAGNTVDFTSLDLSGKTRESVSRLAAHYFQLYASTDAFASSTAVGSVFDLGPANSTAWFTRSVDLTPLPSVPAGTTLSLRLYGVYTNTVAPTTQDDFILAFFGSSTTGTNDISISGVIPEPTSLALVGLTAIRLLGRRRK